MRLIIDHRSISQAREQEVAERARERRRLLEAGQVAGAAE